MMGLLFCHFSIPLPAASKHTTVLEKPLIYTAVTQVGAAE